MVRKQANRENAIAWAFFLVTVLAVNPPVLTAVNRYFVIQPLLAGWPTMWLYLTFWYVVMLIGFVFFAMRFRSWQVEGLEREVDEQTGRGVLGKETEQ